MNSNVTVFPSFNSVSNKRTLQKSCNTTESNLIHTLYQISPILFSEDMINALFKIYEQEEFNILNFSLFQELAKCEMFMDFLKNDSEEKNKNFEKVFNIYFNCLAATRLNINAIIFKNKVCTLLKMNIKIPSYRSGVSLKNINVNVSTTYKPLDTNNITATCDIVNVIKEGFFNSIDSSNIETFTFTPQTATVVIQGPMLKNIINSTINMQSQLMQTGRAHGIKIEPFIENTNKKLLI